MSRAITLGVRLALLVICFPGSSCSECPSTRSLGCSFPPSGKKIHCPADAFYIFSPAIKIEDCGVKVTGFNITYSGRCWLSFTLFKPRPSLLQYSIGADIYFTFSRHPELRIVRDIMEENTHSVSFKNAPIISEPGLYVFGLMVEQPDNRTRCALSVADERSPPCGAMGELTNLTYTTARDVVAAGQWSTSGPLLLNFAVSVSDVDECGEARAVCPSGTTCKNTPGSYHCLHQQPGSTVSINITPRNLFSSGTPINQTMTVQSTTNKRLDSDSIWQLILIIFFACLSVVTIFCLAVKSKRKLCRRLKNGQENVPPVERVPAPPEQAEVNEYITILAPRPTDRDATARCWDLHGNFNVTKIPTSPKNRKQQVLDDRNGTISNIPNHEPEDQQRNTLSVAARDEDRRVSLKRQNLSPYASTTLSAFPSSHFSCKAKPSCSSNGYIEAHEVQSTNMKRSV